MPYLLVKSTIVAVILGMFAFFTQAEATPRFPLNEVTTPATPVGYGHGYGGYGRGYGRYGGGYGRWYGGYGRAYGGYGGGYGYGGYGRGCGRDYY
jgi:hypothetical protein